MCVCYSVTSKINYNLFFDCTLITTGIFSHSVASRWCKGIVLIIIELPYGLCPILIFKLYNTKLKYFFNKIINRRFGHGKKSKIVTINIIGNA